MQYFSFSFPCSRFYNRNKKKGRNGRKCASIRFLTRPLKTILFYINWEIEEIFNPDMIFIYNLRMAKLFVTCKHD